MPATVPAHPLGVRTVLFGTAVALSVDLSAGESRGLTEAQVQRIRDAVTRRPSLPTREVLAESFASWPDLADAFQDR